MRLYYIMYCRFQFRTTFTGHTIIIPRWNTGVHTYGKNGQEQQKGNSILHTALHSSQNADDTNLTKIQNEQYYTATKK